MSNDPLSDRITRQYSYRRAHGDIWRVLDRVVDTSGFLNLGYSAWYHPHFLGSSQARLARHIATHFSDSTPASVRDRILDVGCGRGGPTVELSRNLDVRVTGVDLVPYNLKRARAYARDRNVPASFVVGDAGHLPFPDGAFSAVSAVDSIVYMPDKPVSFREIERVLRPGGRLVASDLVARPDLDQPAEEAVASFARWWDMAPIVPVDEYQTIVEAAGFTVRVLEDITPHSVGRFRKYTRAYLVLANLPGPDAVITRVLHRWGSSPDRITGQIRATHDALPHLRHILLHAHA